MEDLLDKFSSSAPPSASSGGPAYSQLVDEVADLKATGPPHHPPADEKYISLFPESLDRTLAPLDDAIMSVVQSAARGPMGSTVVMLAKIGTVCTTIEVGLTVPVMLFMLRCRDCEGIYAMYVMLSMTILTQLPKRFLWRVRPYASGRAECFSNVTTSCFPSRAVVGAVVFANLAHTIFHMSSGAYRCMPPWFPSFGSWCLIFACALLASLCRIVLGVHYASDCLGGFLLGVVVNLVGTGLARLHMSSCRCNSADSSEVPPLALTVGSGILLVALLGASVVSVLLMLRPPLVFFRKTLHAFSMLFVALIFSLVFLCPAGGPSYLLNEGSATVDEVIIACFLSGVLSAAGMAAQNHKALKKSIPTSLGAFVVLLCAGLLVVATSPFPRPSRL